ncbi:MAG TPA: ABC transporter ATP-binding protein [Candidatus Sulfomarinibacteraceae bacterium]|nr:ABC transporter ATP-binding protein [Candidatus Sulfomarinibacteraceae bacterium]
MNLTVSDVHFTYPSGVTALQGVDLTVNSGESVAIIGENGAGKTTLAKHFNGLLKADRGNVQVGDWNTREHTVAQLAARVAYAFQNPDEQLFARRVWDEVAFGPRNLGVEQEALDERVAQALAAVGLEGQDESHPYDLSQPERRLVSLAAVLAMQTPVLLLDEPTTGLDVKEMRRVGSVVEELRARGHTVLTITHDMDFCADYFARVVVMAGGRVVADGPASEILTKKQLLADAGVEPPQLVRLALALDLPGAPLTADEFLESYAQWRNKEEET